MPSRDKSGELRWGTVDHLMPLAIAFAIGCSITYTAAGIWKNTVEAGDVLSFFGSLIGVGLAVIGALYVERRKVADREHRDFTILKDALTEFCDVVAVYGELNNAAVNAGDFSRGAGADALGYCYRVQDAVKVARMMMSLAQSPAQFSDPNIAKAFVIATTAFDRHSSQMDDQVTRYLAEIRMLDPFQDPEPVSITDLRVSIGVIFEGVLPKFITLLALLRGRYSS